MSADQLLVAVSDIDIKSVSCGDVENAIDEAIACSNGKAIIALGSLYLAGEIRHYFSSHEIDKIQFKNSYWRCIAGFCYEEEKSHQKITN